MQRHQTRRPEHFAQVEQVVHRDHHGTVPCRHIHHGLGFHVEDDGQRGEGHGRQPERPFFRDQPPAIFPNAIPIRSSQGPDVQQHKRSRHNDDHLFGHAANDHAQPSEPQKKCRVAHTGGGILTGRAGLVRGGIKPQPGQQEETAQDILAGGDPGHTFHPRGMARPKQRRGQSNTGTSPGPLPNQEEQEPRIERKQNGICQVAAPRRTAGDFLVEHEAHPEQRCPVVFRGGGEGQLEAFAGEAIPDHVAVFHVHGVVEGDEIVADGRQIKGEGYDHHQQASSCHPAAFTG
ncbi:MAG: hypothetical protein BWX54_01046 [Verrucomicrobia bacterium ADurb.Bin018]|nr:MAG: hypothetical protein BWX54_01046 [Verrucomicrobia bacterium ADurb.Bin018]